MTPEQIQALSGAELDAAIAEAWGWTWHPDLPVDLRWHSPKGDRCEFVPAYHAGAELGRIIVALVRAGCNIMPGGYSYPSIIVHKPVDATSGWTIQHKDEVTGILQAYLRLKTNEEKTNDA